MEQVFTNETNLDCEENDIVRDQIMDQQEMIQEDQSFEAENMDAQVDQITSEMPEIEEIVLGGEPEEVDLISMENLSDAEECFTPDDLLEFGQAKCKTQEELRDYYNSIKASRDVGVYAKINSDGYIIDLRSDMFTKDLEGFIKIDEGDGDRFVYAESSYFEEELMDENGNYRYKFQNIQE